MNDNTRKIIHLDLDAFYCAVEEMDNPDLRGRAFAVGGRPEARGVVASCSYAARAKGVRSAMPMGRALRLCSKLIVVSGRHSRYAEESKKIMRILREFTGLVEQLSIDEAFLDVSDRPEPAEAIARTVQERIRMETGLPASLGVASNKLVAKIASDHGKSLFEGEGAPNAVTIVPPGEEAVFLAPLPVRALWGIGPVTDEKLKELGIRTIGDLARADASALAERFGRHGAEMGLRAQGIDRSPIVTEREAKSVSQEMTFSRDVRDEARLRAEIRKQSDRVAGSLRRHGLSATTIRIKLRWPDFTTLTRQVKLTSGTDDPDAIDEAAWGLVMKVWKPGKPVRLIGVGASGLGSGPEQLRLFDLHEESR
ncbi:MAG TPA: DNA polymerase IV [Anaerolineales bacterium]|nr:DNA polymerase IV [Anaerolineales bacterium]